MTIRTILYGYEFSGTKKSVNKGEALIVKEVFDRYIKGETFKQIADALTERNITYYLENKIWNKNIISRMVDDIRYIGNDEYPPIVTPEVYSLAKSKRAEKSAKKEKLPDITELIKSKLVCSRCGNRYTRRSKWKTREKWICPDGCKTSVYLDDKTLFENIEKALKKVAEGYASCNLSNEIISSADIQKRENEIDRISDINDSNCKMIIGLILEGASLKYDCCKLRYNNELDHIIRNQYLSQGCESLIDKDLIEETVNKIYVEEDGTVRIELRSGSEIKSA